MINKLKSSLISDHDHFAFGLQRVNVWEKGNNNG